MIEVKGWPIVGCVPTIIKAIIGGKGGAENVFHKYHSELGAIYKMKLLGRYREGGRESWGMTIHPCSMIYLLHV